jgi:hypothetical protein
MVRPRKNPPEQDKESSPRRPDAADNGGGGVVVAEAENVVLTDTTETVPLTQTGNVLDQAAAKAVDDTGVLSESDRRFLSRRNAVENALKNVESAKSELADATTQLEDIKKVVKGKEAAMEAAWMNLYRAEREDPQPEQMGLFETAANGASMDDEELQERHDEWEDSWDNDFLGQDIVVLDLPDGTNELLREHTNNIVTLGDLQDAKKDGGADGLRSIKGIGEEKERAIEDAYTRVMNEWLVKNPEPRRAEAQDPAGSDAVTDDYDFESKFPEPVNPTPNETYDTEYHREIINTAIAQTTDLRQRKAQIADQVDENGTPLTDRKRKKINDAIAETQMQLDEGYRLYGEAFGARAAERLAKYVEQQFDKSCKLKGGIE